LPDQRQGTLSVFGGEPMVCGGEGIVDHALMTEFR